MQAQVFRSCSEADNSVFTSTVVHSGIPLWSWVITHPDSQFEIPEGTNACSVASLQFAKLVLLRASHDLSRIDAGAFLAEILRRDFFDEVLAICARGPENFLSIEEAFSDARYQPRFLSLSPLLYGSPNRSVPTQVQVAELLAGLEEIQLPSALTLTSGGHIRVCVYIPFRPVPLFLVFDSAMRFGRGASVVVHTTRASATAHLATMCAPNAVEAEDSLLRPLSGDFFILRTTDLHTAKRAAMVLDLRFGAERVARDLARATAPSPDASPAAVPEARQTAHSQRRPLRDITRNHFTGREGVHLGLNTPSTAVDNPPARHSPRIGAPRPMDGTSDGSVLSNPASVPRPPVRASMYVAPQASRAYPTPPESTPRSYTPLPLPILHPYTGTGPNDLEAQLRRAQRHKLRERLQREQLGVLADLEAQGVLDRYAEAELQRPWMNSTLFYAGVV
ncbi:hypothetical protein B0H11DRAFT_2221594 [Mycena galericulata]|nr:hypothetical protein B0H11DRAFT_2221594 [Mycena galericulata]